jgi:hypothetical protein
MDNPFANVEPEVFDPTLPLCCPQAEAMLAPGNWVIFENDDTDSQSEEEQDVLVGLILKTDPSKEKALQVNVFITVTKLLIRQLQILVDSNPRSKWIPRMLRTRRSKWITSKNVLSIAWVFSPTSIDRRPNEGHQGTSNLFLLAHDDTGAPIARGCYPFCSSCGLHSMNVADCYQERVWNGLQTLRAEMSRHLGRCSEKQSNFPKVSSNIVLGRETWRYLLLKVRKEISPPKIRLACAYKSLLSPGLILTSVPVHANSEMVRFDTAQELSNLSSELGELVTVGVRKRRPKHGIEKSLHVNDVINVVAGSEEREEPFLHRTSEQGIDLTFDGVNHVRLRMRCQRFQCGDACPSTILSRIIARKIPLGGAESDETSSDDDSDDDDAAAKVGMEFEKDLVQCQIRSIDAPMVTAVVCCPKDMAGGVETFELWCAESWIKIQQQKRSNVRQHVRLK